MIARATEGRTCHAGELFADQQPAVMRVAKDAAGEPVGFAEAVLASWKTDTPERAALMAWLEAQG